MTTASEPLPRNRITMPPLEDEGLHLSFRLRWPGTAREQWYLEWRRNPEASGCTATRRASAVEVQMIRLIVELSNKLDGGAMPAFKHLKLKPYIPPKQRGATE